MKKILSKALVMALALVSVTAAAQTTNYKTYSLFIYSFTKYIEWPADSRNGDFVIAVLGSSKLAEELHAGVDGRKVGTQAIRIVEVSSVEELANAHLVFVADTRSAVTEKIIAAYKGKPLLVVTERDGLTRRGAGVSFVISEDKTLRFQLNEATLAERRLKVAASLMKLAEKDT